MSHIKHCYQTIEIHAADKKILPYMVTGSSFMKKKNKRTSSVPPMNVIIDLLYFISSTPNHNNNYTTPTTNATPVLGEKKSEKDK